MREQNGIIVSVIMPVYNGEEFLEEVIESVCKQSLKEWEFIIINDCSTDKTEDIIKKYAKTDERIVYLKNEKNSGVARSLNRGLEHAKGKYVARVDADDPIYKYRLETQVDYMEQHPEVGILGSGYMYDDGKIEKPHIPLYQKKEEIKASFLIGNYIAHSTVMFRKEIFDKYGLKYNADFKLEDYELWTRAVKHMEITVLKQILIKHRVHPASVCSTMGKAFYNNINQIVCKFVGEVYGIDTSKYADEHFYAMNIDLKTVVKGDYYKFAADEFMLLCEIEKANREVGFVDKLILAKVLKQRWNWVIWCLKLEGVSNKLPHLEENEFGTFRSRIVYELLKNKVIKDEDMQDTLIAEKMCGESVPRKTSRIIVYGAGTKCYDYFKPDSEEIDTEYVKVVAFCDRDTLGIGKTLFGKKVITPDGLKNEEYDKIAVTSNKFFNEIKKQLIEKYGIDEKKIVNMNTIDLN